MVFQSYPDQATVEARMLRWGARAVYHPPGELLVRSKKCTRFNARSEACGGLLD
jgi:hypothetical protein